MSWKLLLRPRRWSAGQVAWLVMLCLLVVPALLSGPGDPLAREVLGWRPDRAWTEPWRWWSAAWLHLSTSHLLANLSGALLVAALGWLLQPDRRMAWAWALAWPLTHLSLLLQPGMTRYGGLSGVLHAGVAVCAVWLWARGVQRGEGRREGRGERHLGQALAAGLLVKLLLERAWEAPLNRVAGLDIVVAPLAHAAGAFWGAVLALAVIRLTSDGRSSRPTPG